MLMAQMMARVRSIAKMSQADCFADIPTRWNEHDGHHWCHTSPMRKLWQPACSMARGIRAIGSEWIVAIHDTLHISIFGVDTVKITERVAMTMTHL